LGGSVGQNAPCSGAIECLDLQITLDGDVLFEEPKVLAELRKRVELGMHPHLHHAARGDAHLSSTLLGKLPIENKTPSQRREELAISLALAQSVD
jgi:hypothetical protein